MPLRLPSGTSVGGPLQTNTQSAQQRVEIHSKSFRSNYRLWFDEFTDFAASTLALPWAAKIVGTTPTFAQGTNSIDGFFTGTLAATSEAETVGVDWGDVLMLTNPSAGRTNVNAIFNPVFEAYIRIPTALTTAQTMVIGLATGFNATLTSISKYVWFRIGPATMAVTIESKDGTNTNLLQAPADGTLTLAASSTTYSLFTIDWTLREAVRMFIDDHFLGYLNMGALAATDKFQPVVYLQKASGTTTPTFDIDWAATSAWRPDF